MTTTTPSPGRDGAAAARGFTLVEMLVGSTLAAFILTAVMTTFLFLGRSGANVQNYNDMEAQSRRALEQFAQDVRQASEITWNAAGNTTVTVNGVSTVLQWANGGSVTLNVDSVPVTYVYATNQRGFYRLSAARNAALVTSIVSFQFNAYSITGATVSLTDLAAAGRQTKQLQISLEAQRTSRTVARATNLVLSARYILRNKRVTT
jgi:prepilin-type N-terminal cleavage/methylation domain-containing protein